MIACIVHYFIDFVGMFPQVI